MKYTARKDAVKDLKKIKDGNIKKKINKALLRIKSYTDIHQMILDPKCKKMHGSDNAFRIRAGEYRIGFYATDEKIIVHRILNRKEMYNKFPESGLVIEKNILMREKLNEGKMSWNDILSEFQIAGYKIKEIVKGKQLEASGGPAKTPDIIRIEWDGKNEKSLMLRTNDDNFKNALDLKSIEELMDELIQHFEINESMEPSTLTKNSTYFIKYNGMEAYMTYIGEIKNKHNFDNSGQTVALTPSEVKQYVTNESFNEEVKEIVD